MKRNYEYFLLFLPGLDLGGASRRVQVYCEYLRKEHFRPIVVFQTHNIQRNIKSILGEKTPYVFLSDPKEIAKFAKKKKIRVFYFFYDGQFNEQLAKTLAELRDLNVKIVANNIFAYYDQRMDDLCDLVLFQTKMMLAIKFAKKHSNIRYPKYGVLPNPVNTKYLQSLKLPTGERAKVKASLGFSDKDFIVGRFGRNDIVKWGDTLTQVFFSRCLLPTVKFLIVGMPRSRKIFLYYVSLFLPQLKQRLVVLEPTSDDRKLMGYMQIVDVVGHAVNIGEGCSNAINEAMYWGKPVLTNSTPHCDNGQVEQVVHKKTGFVVNGSKEWVDKINYLASHKKIAAKLGKNGRKRCLEQWNGDKISQLLLYYFDSLIEKKLQKPKGLVEKKDLISFRQSYYRSVRTQKMDSTLVQKGFELIIRTLNYIEHVLDM